MADFCAQCAERLGHPGTGLAGLVSAEDWVSGVGAAALCEGCGVTEVDHEGRCQGQCLDSESTRGAAAGPCPASG